MVNVDVRNMHAIYDHCDLYTSDVTAKQLGVQADVQTDRQTDMKIYSPANKENPSKFK